MTQLQLDILRVARVFGPLSNADVGRRLGIAPDKTYRQVKELEGRGLLIHPRLQRWDISELGRDVFQRMPKKDLSLFQEQAR